MNVYFIFVLIQENHVFFLTSASVGKHDKTILIFYISK